MLDERCGGWRVEARDERLEAKGSWLQARQVQQSNEPSMTVEYNGVEAKVEVGGVIPTGFIYDSIIPHPFPSIPILILIPFHLHLHLHLNLHLSSSSSSFISIPTCSQSALRRFTSLAFLHPPFSPVVNPEGEDGVPS